MLILNEDFKSEAETALKNQKRALVKGKEKVKMPGINEFISQIKDFKIRVEDTTNIDNYNKNLMVEGRKSVQPIKIDIGGSNKMVFGIRRDSNDLEGNKI